MTRSQTLYLKWRPTRFEEVVGQDHVVQTIRNALQAERVAHAYLFSGPRGTGKTSTARLLAKALNCTNPELAQRPDNTCPDCEAVNAGRYLDLIEIDAASNTGVDDVRDLREKINFAPNQARYKVYIIDECFRYGDLVTLADGSKLPIGKIVEAGLHVDVLSYNEQTHRIEPKPVTRHMKKQPQLPMVRITFDNNRALVCTINHKFYTPKGQVRAGDLEVDQFVYAGYERISQQQLAVIVGSALGDGHIALTSSRMRARLSITQGVEQKGYLDYKAQLLGNLVRTLPAYQYLPQSYSRKGIYRLSTVSRPQIAELQRELYDHRGHKRISCAYLDRLTPLALAIWYLDDGSLTTQANRYKCKDGTVANYPATRSVLSVHGLSFEEARLTMQWFQEKWDIGGGVSATAKGPVIWLTLPGTERLHEIIAPYVPPCMAYKLLPAYHNKFDPLTDDGTPAGLAVSIVKSIERVPPPEYVYNIEVADNHNYFARDILVANCHMLSNAAFNALLKTLEEPPPHAIFVLATTEVHKVPLTVTSRCQRHTFRRIAVPEIVERLEQIVREEGLHVEPEVLQIVARLATGSLRDAISLLDQLIVTPDELVASARAREVFGISGGEAVRELVAALAERQADAGLDLINRVVDEGADPRQFARQVVDYLRGLVLIKMGSAALLDVSAELQTDMAIQAEPFAPRELLHAVRAFDEAARDRRGGWLGQLPLELALMSCLGHDVAPEMTAAAVKASPGERGKPSAPARGSQAAKKEQPAPRTEPPAAPPPAGYGLATLMPQWGDLVARSRKHHHALPALLVWCQPVTLEDDLLTLGFKKDFAMSKVNTAEMLPLLEAALAEVTGHSLRVKCVRRDVETSEDLPDVNEEGVVAMGVKLGARPREID